MEHGFGLWIIESHSGEFVGDCGLTMQEVEGEWFVEAGWHVRSGLRAKVTPLRQPQLCVTWPVTSAWNT